VEPLKKIGMTDMFDMAKADLSGMTGGAKSLYVSKVSLFVYNVADSW
jgi:hypothetical protein